MFSSVSLLSLSQIGFNIDTAFISAIGLRTLWCKSKKDSKEYAVKMIDKVESPIEDIRREALSKLLIVLFQYLLFLLLGCVHTGGTTKCDGDNRLVVFVLQVDQRQ